MNTRTLRKILGVVLAGIFAPGSFASFNFSWSGPTTVNVGQSYSVGVSAYFAANNGSDPYFTVSLYRSGSQVGSGSGSPYTWASASNSFSDSTPGSVGYSADAQSYYGEYGSSSRSVTINSAGIATTFSFSGSGQTYDGTTKYLTVTPSPSNATYSTSGNYWGVSAGTYIAYASATGSYVGSQSYQWTIAKGNQSTVSISASSTSITAGQSVSFSASGGSGTGSYSWSGASGSGSSASATFNSPGDYTVSVSRSGDSNYNGSNTASVSIHVNAAPVSTTFSISPTSFTYNGSSQGPSITPSPSGATYSTSGTTSATNAGSYSVSATATGGYTGSSGSVSWSIAKANQSTVSISGPSTMTAGISSSFSASGGSGSGSYSWSGASGSGSSASAMFSSPGDYTVSVSRGGDSNYNGSNTASMSVHVNAATISASFSVSPTSFTYNGGSQGPSINPTPANATYTTSGTTSATNAGSYSVTATATGGYTGTSGAVSWSIAPANQSSVSISPTSTSVTAGTPVSFSASGGSGTGSYSWSGASGSGSSASATFSSSGDYTVSVYRQGDSNYNSSNTASASIHVDPATTSTSFTISPTVFTYTGSPQGPSITPSPAGATYTTSGTTSATAAGDYSVTATANGSYSGSSGSVAWRINKANQSTVAISPLSSNVSVNTPVLFTASGGTGTGAYTWGGQASGTGPTKSVTFSSAGTYTVTVYRAGDTNYNDANTATATIVVSNGQPQTTVTISPTARQVPVTRSATFTASGGSGVLNYTWGGSASGTGDTKTVTFNTVGTTTVTVVNPANGAYDVSNTATATVTVVPPVAPWVTLAGLVPIQAYANDTMTLSTLVSDDDGDIRNVEIYWNGAPAQSWLNLTSTTEIQLFTTVTPTGTTLGDRPVHAWAADGRTPAGVGTADATVYILPPNVPPVMGSVSANVVSASQIQLSGSAHDSDGNLSRIDFYVSVGPDYNGYSLVGSANVSGTDGSGTFVWQPSPALAAGTYFIWARAMDKPPGTPAGYAGAIDSNGGSFCSFTVGTVSTPTVAVSPYEVAVGESVSVNYTGAPGSSSWVGLYRVGDADTATPLAQATVPAIGNGALSFTISSGVVVGQTYQARLFAGSGTSTRLAVSNSFSITEKFSVNVVGGAFGDGSTSVSGQTANTQFSLFADLPPNGQVFAGWTLSGAGQIGDPSKNITTFTVGIGNATITAHFQVAVAPTITTQPQGATLNVGQNAVFTVAATGAPAPSYQWRKNGRPIKGTSSTLPTLHLTNISTADAGSYSVDVYNSTGSTLSVPANLTVTAPNGEDTDQDGMPDWWEVTYLNNTGASPTGDADGDGLINIDEYNLWRNPASTNPAADVPDLGVPIAISVAGKLSGSTTGTATVSFGGQSYTFRFEPQAGQVWLKSTVFAQGDLASAELMANLGQLYTVGVTTSGLADFIVTTSVKANVSGHLQARVESDGHLVDSIKGSEIQGNQFTLRAVPSDILPFGAIDTSRLEVNRLVSFGLGGRLGQSAGKVLFYADRFTIAEGERMGFTIIDGPAIQWKPTNPTPTHFQAKVPAGYVDIVRTHAVIHLRYFPDGTYATVGGYKDFGSATPLISYDLAGTLCSPSGSITRSAGGVTSVLEFETGWDCRSETFHTDADSLHNIQEMTTLHDTYQSFIRLWSWHAPAASRDGLSVAWSKTERTAIGFGNPPNLQYTYNPITVRLTRYDGASETATVLAGEKHDFGTGDNDLAYELAGWSGYGAEEHLLWSHISDTTATLAIRPLLARNEAGGEVRTTYYSAGGMVGGAANYGSQPVFAHGKPMEVRQSFLNGLATDASALATTYTYAAELVDGDAVPLTAVTQQGSTTIGDVSFEYPVSADFNGAATVSVSTKKRPYSGATLLTTTARSFSRRIADVDLRGKPVSITNSDGTKVSYAYWRVGAELHVGELTGKVGSAVSAFLGAAVEPLDLDADHSTATERVFSAEGRLKREATYLFRGGSNFVLLTAVDYGYDALGHLTSKTDVSGRVLYEASYTGLRKTLETDEQGTALSYTYDDYERVLTMTRASASSGGLSIPAMSTSYEYFANGQLKGEMVTPYRGGSSLDTLYTYDTSGRPKSRTLPGRFTTSITYTNATNIYNDPNPRGAIEQTSLPGGGTKTEERFRDGRALSITGDAVPDTSYSYSYNATSGFLQTAMTKGAGATTITTTTYADWLGRTDHVDTPALSGTTPTTRTVSYSYDAQKGQLLAQFTKVGATNAALPRLFSYDDYGRLLREGLDANANNAIDTGVDYDVQEHEFAYQQDPVGIGTGWYRYDGTKVWPYDGTNAGTAHYSAQAYTQVGGLSASTAGHAVVFDFDRNRTETTATVDRANAAVSTATATTGTTQTVTQLSVNGLPVSSTNAQGQTTTQFYDGAGRLVASNDPRIGTTDYDYYAETNLLWTVSMPDGQQTTYAYDTAGRVSDQADNAGKHAYYRYDAAGNLTHQWGETVNPARYEYNDLGQRTKLHTYRSGTWTGQTLPGDFAGAGDVTTWTYYSTTGLLLSKQDALNPPTSYEYTVLDQISKRTDSRGWITLYEYNDPRKLLTKVDYTGEAETATTDVERTYDRAGRLKTVKDAATAGTSESRSFSYYDNGSSDTDLLNRSARLQTETLPSFLGGHQLTYNYQYGVAGRANGALSGMMLDTGSLYQLAYGYDAVLRLNSIAYNGTPFTYTYVPNSNLIDVVGGYGGYVRDYDYQANSNRLEKLAHRWGTSANTFETRLEYDALGRRSTEKTRSADYMALLGRGTEWGVHIDYSYTDAVPTNTVDRSELRSSGKYVLAPDWSAGGLRTATARDYTYDAMGNRTADNIGGTAGIYTPNGLNQYDATPGLGALGYDANGNLISDGLNLYDYDAENRLIKVTTPSRTLTEIRSFAYDYLGRRIRKTDFRSGSDTRYLYDGWNLVAELDQTGTIQRKFVWGLDVSGSLQGAGGVGGLLLIDGDAGELFPIYDASHNVIGLYNSSLDLAAAYEYDPFGNLQTSAGSYAASNPFRSATKYTDDETGLVYYGLRYYNPSLGRFINRDPIQEAGGLNLYGFCGNDGVNRFDYLGMDGDPFENLYRNGDPRNQGGNGSSPTGPNGEQDGKSRDNGNGGSETYHTDGWAGSAWYDDTNGDWSTWKFGQDTFASFLMDRDEQNARDSSDRNDPNRVANATTGGAEGLGWQLWLTGALRDEYVGLAKQFPKGVFSPERIALAENYQLRQTAIGKELQKIVIAGRKAREARTMLNAGKTNPVVNATAANMRVAGRMLMGAAAAYDAYKIVSAPDGQRTEVTVRTAARWTYALAGSEVGGELGASFGPWGAAFGALAGGAWGGITGDKVAEPWHTKVTEAGSEDWLPPMNN